MGENSMTDETVEKPKALRGFALLTDERRREIAKRGGLSVPPEKRTYSRNKDIASEAGKKGGTNVPADRRAFFMNRELAAEAGRKGGSAKNAIKE
jgi:general stress protein YciG